MATTTRKTVNELHAVLCKAYEDQLLAFGDALKKKTRETLLDGFRDGCASGIRHALKMCDVEVVEE